MQAEVQVSELSGRRDPHTTTSPLMVETATKRARSGAGSGRGRPARRDVQVRARAPERASTSRMTSTRSSGSNGFVTYSSAPSSFGPIAVGLSRLRGAHDDVRTRRSTAELGEHEPPVEHRHHDVEHDEVRCFLVDAPERGLAVGREQGIEAFGLEDHPQGEQHVGLVVDDQHLRAIRHAATSARCSAVRVRSQGDAEGGAAAGRVLDPDGSTAGLDQTTNDREAEPHSGLRPVRVDAVEPLEDPLALLGRNARAAVDDRQHDLVRRSPARSPGPVPSRTCARSRSGSSSTRRNVSGSARTEHCSGSSSSTGRPATSRVERGEADQRAEIDQLHRRPIRALLHSGRDEHLLDHRLEPAGLAIDDVEQLIALTRIARFGGRPPRHHGSR